MEPTVTTEKVVDIYYTADNKGRYATPTKARRAAMAILAEDEHRFDVAVRQIIVTENGEYVAGKDAVCLPHWAGDKLGYYHPVNGSCAPETITVEQDIIGPKRIVG